MCVLAKENPCPNKNRPSTSPKSHCLRRDSLKKRYKLDTIIITRLRNYNSLADSLAYHGQIRKVYGPYDKGRVLVQVLGKLPNTFNRISQIYLDTTVFSRKFADSLANSIIQRIKSGAATFEEMAQTYSMGGEGITKGDLGWVAQGVLIPQVDKALVNTKKARSLKCGRKPVFTSLKKQRTLSRIMDLR